MTPGFDSDGLGDVVAAVGAYLAELDGYRTVVLRRERWVTVRDREDGLRVGQEFPAAAGITESLRATVMRLPGWDETVWWRSERKRWGNLLHRERGGVEGEPWRLAALRGVAWDGRP